MKRTLIVSNTLPIRITRRKGEMKYHPSPGGLASGLSPIYKEKENLWIGWPGIASSNKAERNEIKTRLEEENLFPVFLPQRDLEKYYEGFSNNTIWPLFHYFTISYTI